MHCKLNSTSRWWENYKDRYHWDVFYLSRHLFTAADLQPSLVSLKFRPYTVTVSQALQLQTDPPLLRPQIRKLTPNMRARISLRLKMLDLQSMNTTKKSEYIWFRLSKKGSLSPTPATPCKPWVSNLDKPSFQWLLSSAGKWKQPLILSPRELI